jgi:uncharacterized membrane protein YphA (DoxX/SURF4 family)
MKPFFPSKLAEIIFALIIGYFGYMHLKNAGSMAGMVPDYLPGQGKIWIYLVGAGMVLAALAIITGLLKTIACYLLAAELIVLVLAIHLKPALNNDALHTGMLLKDTAMAMCAILIGNRK